MWICNKILLEWIKLKYFQTKMIIKQCFKINPVILPVSKWKKKIRKASSTKMYRSLILHNYVGCRDNLLKISLLKGRFCYYLGMVKPTDEDTIVIEKIVCYSHRSQEACYGGRRGGHRKASGLVRKQRQWGENMGKNCGFCKKGWERQGNLI